MQILDSIMKVIILIPLLIKRFFGKKKKIKYGEFYMKILKLKKNLDLDE